MAHLYDMHVFVCENERPEGHPRGCCAAGNASEFLNTLKDLCRTQGTHGKRVRVNRSGCLDVCERGPAVVIYPEGIWYFGVTPQDAQRVYEEHILGGRVVEDLLAPQKVRP